MCTWGQNNFGLVIVQDFGKPLSEFRMPEYLIKSHKVIQAWENMKRENDISFDLFNRLFKPVKLCFGSIKRAFIILFEIHGVKSQQRNVLVWEVMSIESSFHKSFSRSSWVKTLGLLVSWEPNIKKLWVVLLWCLWITWHLIMDYHIIITNRWEETCIWELTSDHVHIICNDFFHFGPCFLEITGGIV